MNAPMSAAHQVRTADLDDAGEIARIREFAEQQGASVFQLPSWVSAVEAGTGQRAAGLVAEQLGVITGWLPLTQVRSTLFGNALVSSGFGVGGGLCTTSAQATQALTRAAQDLVLQGGFASLELRGGPTPHGRGWQSWDNKHCSFERALAADDEAELLAIPRKARAEVRKGLKAGLTVHMGRSNQDLRAHYAVYSESLRNLGTPVFPAKLFRAMLEAFPKDSDILTVCQDGKPLASVLSFYHGGAVLPFWGGGTFAARSARANELMYYELMRHARRRGAQRFDFGRSKTDSGPYKFKKNWGFEPQKLTYTQWSKPGQTPRNIDPTSPSYARKIAIWKKIPLPIANRLGPFVARNLA
ncbi:MAG: FemAB family XrtA/PEP-CTERM system-associated protein [Pseudomonadota bacterium]